MTALKLHRIESAVYILLWFLAAGMAWEENNRSYGLLINGWAILLACARDIECRKLIGKDEDN